MMKLRRLEQRLRQAEQRRPADPLPPLPPDEVIDRPEGGTVYRTWFYKDGAPMRLDVICPGNVDLRRL